MQTLNEFSTLIVALSTVTLAAITWRYANCTRGILRENKKSREQQYLPIIIASLGNIKRKPNSHFGSSPGEIIIEVFVKNRGFGPAANVEVIPRKQNLEFETVFFNVVGIDAKETPLKESKILKTLDNSKEIPSKVADFLPMSFDISYKDLLGRDFEAEVRYSKEGREEIIFRKGFEFINDSKNPV